MKGAGRAAVFLFLFLFSRSLTSLISLCPCHMLNHRKWERINQKCGLSQISMCGVGSSNDFPFTRGKMGRQAHGNVSTSSCDRPGVITHVPAPPSQFYQYILMRNKVEKISSWVPISKRHALYWSLSCSSLQSNRLGFSSMCPYLPLEQSGMKKSSRRGPKRKKRKKRKTNTSMITVYRFRTTLVHRSKSLQDS